MAGELERVRQRQVERLLRDTALSRDAIAARVGYSASRALRRAVNCWYRPGLPAIRSGSTPS